MGNIRKEKIIRAIGLGCPIDSNRRTRGSDKEGNGRTDRANQTEPR